MARKQSNIYYRKDGRWEGRLHISGTKKYRSVYGKSYNEAKAKLDNLRKETALPVRKCSMTFCEVILLWLEGKKFAVRESSLNVYRLKFHKHIEPFFSKMKYDNITPRIVNRFVASKIQDGFSSGYIADIVSMLRSAAKWAAKVYGYSDMLRNVELPKSQKKEAVLLNTEQNARLQNILLSRADNKICLAILLAMFTGLRIGEVCGLKSLIYNDQRFFAEYLFVIYHIIFPAAMQPYLQSVFHHTDRLHALFLL